MTAVGFLWQFTYDQNGMRTSRTNGNRVYNYVYNGDSLRQVTVDNHDLNFTYDASGRPLTLIYDGTTYYYSLNLQGDVTAILDRQGNTVVSYTYNAWGCILSITGSEKDTVGFYNPLRYRGYVWDPETGLYYLQSRYYSPGLGRFINADALVSTGQGLLGNNMFAYCGNNPVNYIDSLGLSPMYPWEDVPGYLGRLIGEWISEVIQTDEEETDEKGNTTFKAKVKKTAKSVGRNVEFSAGFGQGYYAEADVMEFGASIGMYGNYGTINYKDGKWYTGQEVNIGLSLSATQWLEVGFGDYTFLQSGKVIESSTWAGLNNTKESWTIFSAAAYFIAGGSIYVGFDLNTFLTDFESIWMEG